MGAAYRDAVVRHCEARWDASRRSLVWPHGPLASDGMRVHQFETEAGTVFCTVGADGGPRLPYSVEFHMVASSGEHWADIVELLYAIASFHRDTRLDMAHTVNFGRPWLPGSSCDHAVLSRPYLFGPELEWMSVPRTRFLWVIPITLAEREFKRRHGLDALEERFEAAQFRYRDPGRPSVV